MQILIYVIIGLCIAGLIIGNVYFRFRMMKHYKALMQQKVVFSAGDVFNSKKMDAVIKRHPKQSELIRIFLRTLHRSTGIILALLLILLICGGILYAF